MDSVKSEYVKFNVVFHRNGGSPIWDERRMKMERTVESEVLPLSMIDSPIYYYNFLYKKIFMYDLFEERRDLVF
jgi:hypothetical protein